jgi:hypothetical protein
MSFKNLNKGVINDLIKDSFFRERDRERKIFFFFFQSLSSTS